MALRRANAVSLADVGKSHLQTGSATSRGDIILADVEADLQAIATNLGLRLISDALPFGRLWYGEPDPIANAISYAKFFSRSHNAAIRVYDAACNVIETHDHAGDFRDW